MLNDELVFEVPVAEVKWVWLEMHGRVDEINRFWAQLGKSARRHDLVGGRENFQTVRGV